LQFENRYTIWGAALPGIAVVIGNAMVEMVTTGQWSQLERLRGALDPRGLF
jgi:hypothetical protein